MWFLHNSQLPQVASQGTQMPVAAKMFMRLHWPLLAKNLKQGRPRRRYLETRIRLKAAHPQSE